MIVLIPHMNLLNLFWIIKCLFLRTMEPLIHNNSKPVSKIFIDGNSELMIPLYVLK